MANLELLDQFVIDRRRAAPLHMQIQNCLRKAIESHFNDGDKFFREEELAERFGVARATARQALGDLAREGLILRRPSAGTIVTKTAKSSAKAAFQHVGIFVSDYTSEFMMMFLHEISADCRKRDLIPHVYYTQRGQSVRQAYRQISHSPDTERLVVCTEIELVNAAIESGYRLVKVEKPHGYHGPAVETDSSMAIQLGVDYLRSLGHKRIAFLVNEPAMVSSVEEKVARFTDIVPEGLLEVCGTQIGENSYDAAYKRIGEMWSRVPFVRPTAIMTASDPGAWAVMRWFAEHGVKVPSDISVLGFENVRSSAFLHPALSSIAHPIQDLALAALDMLESDSVPSSLKRLPPNLVIRESTGSPPPED